MIIPSLPRAQPPEEAVVWEQHAIVEPPVVPVTNSSLSLFPLDGRLYVGHGEWTSNLGPTNVVSVDPEGGTTVEMEGVMSDALSVFREIGGAVYAPYTDPRGADKGGFATNAGGEWHAVEFTSTLMVHCFDMGATSHGMWMAGSGFRQDQTTVPVVLFSEDAGETWSEALTGERGSLSRFYGLWIEGDTVLVRDRRTGLIYSCSDGQSWTTVDRPDLTLALSATGYRRPRYMRTPNPTPDEQVMRNWASSRPQGASDPVLLSGVAYCAEQTGQSVTIHRAPGPSGVQS